MKIEEIHIYGYGKLENIKLSQFAHLTVFYGENEAGKSTIMSFIHSILFGFPTKQQTELRYEPKKGAKYGGQLIVSFEKQGRTVIERVKGKATGDVRVTLEDGMIGGEELLKELLSFMDKALYQAIFSFNLHGLQNVHQLKSEDLGKFLFSTSAIGSEKLLVVEKDLQKELELRFKPTGKRPHINEKITEVNSFYKDLKIAEQKNNQYGSLLQDKARLLKEIENEQNCYSRLRERLQQLEKWEKISPFVTERKLLEEELNSNGQRPFPIDGISRLEQLNASLYPLEGQLKSLREKNERLKLALEKTAPDYDMIAREAEMNAVFENFPLYNALKEEEAEWRAKQDKLNEEIHERKQRLHIPLSNENLAACNTSIFMSEKVAAAEQKQLRLQTKKSELDEQEKIEKDELHKIEELIEQLKTGLMPLSQREEKQQKLAEANNKNSTEAEIIAMKDKLRFLQMMRKQEKEQERRNKGQWLFVSILFTLLACWGIWDTRLAIVVIGGLGLVVSLYFLFYKNNNRKLDDEIRTLKEREQILQAQVAARSDVEIALLEEQLKKDDEQRKKLQELQLRWNQQNDQFEKVILAFESWERETVAHEKLLLSIGKELFLPDQIALHHLHAAFLDIVKLKEQTRELAFIEQQIEKKAESIQGIEQELAALGAQYLAESVFSVREIALLLKNKLKVELANKIKYDDHLNTLEEIADELETCEHARATIIKEKEKLFEHASVTTEEEYRLVAKADEKRQELTRSLKELTRQIKLSSIPENDMEQLKNIKDLPKELDEVNKNLTDCEQHIQSLQQNVADAKHQINLLEDGGIYADLLHTYRQLQSELEMEAKEWGKYALAKEILRTTVDRFRHERLPAMLVKAEEYLSFLTDGNYIRIIPREDNNGFFIERKDHLLFEANELSQATTEQVYVSLRLALATTIYNKYQFPIIIDDSFVNFDHIRTEKMMHLLQTINGNQLLFFTCHKHLLPYFKEEQIIPLVSDGYSDESLLYDILLT